MLLKNPPPPRAPGVISIIIPAYNAEEWISDALESCLRQKIDLLEVVVVDNGSTDATYSVISRYIEANARTLRVIRTDNSGASAARNIGLDAASGEYVIFLDADDVLSEGAVEYLATVAARSCADIVFGSHLDFYELSGEETPAIKSAMYRDAYANAVGLLYVQGSYLVRNTGLRFNEKRVIWEGLEYLLDFLTPNREAAYADRIVVKVRQHRTETRMSRRFDHFEPAMTGRFFAEQKAKLDASGVLNLERRAALDHRILSNAYALLKVGRGKEADSLFKEISWSNVIKYDWCHVGSLAWAAYWGGPVVGSRAFHYLNKLLGRA